MREKVQIEEKKKKWEEVIEKSKEQQLVEETKARIFQEVINKFKKLNEEVKDKILKENEKKNKANMEKIK